MKPSHPPFVIIPFEILTDSRLTLRQIKVLMAICSWCKSSTNLARISRQMISDRTGYSLPRISNITTELVTLGWLKKSGNLGKKQWAVYEIKELNFKKTPMPKSGTTPMPKSGTTPMPKSGTTPMPKSGTSIDTKVLDTKVLDTKVLDTKVLDTKVLDTKRKLIKKKISYSEKVAMFKPTTTTTDTFKNVYPNLGKPDFLDMIKQFKDQAINRNKQFKDLNAGMRNYIKRKYIAPVKQVVRENEIGSFRDIGDTVRAQIKNNERAGLPKQILINK